ncbi:MAG: ribbon-helix-helix protein, CopG family [Halobacteriales archaeon]
MSSIGVRLPDELLEKLDRLSEEDGLDRSTVIRQLLQRGYADYVAERAAQRYRRGDTTLSGAAEQADRTLWEMQRYLVREGYISSYSIDDLDRELSRLRNRRDP